MLGADEGVKCAPCALRSSERELTSVTLTKVLMVSHVKSSKVRTHSAAEMEKGTHSLLCHDFALGWSSLSTIYKCIISRGHDR